MLTTSSSTGTRERPHNTACKQNAKRKEEKRKRQRISLQIQSNDKAWKGNCNFIRHHHQLNIDRHVNPHLFFPVKLYTLFSCDLFRRLNGFSSAYVPTTFSSSSSFFNHIDQLSFQSLFFNHASMACLFSALFTVPHTHLIKSF